METNLLDELYHALDRDPSSVFLYERLVEVWAERGDKDMVSSIASKLQDLDPENKVATQHLSQESKPIAKKVPDPEKPKSKVLPRETQHQEPSNTPDIKDTKDQPSNTQPTTNLTPQEKELVDGYKSLRLSAIMLYIELSNVYHQLPPTSSSSNKAQEILPILLSISKGKISTVVPIEQPISVRSLAREILSSPSQASDLITSDFETMIRWAGVQDPPLSTDAIRTRLIKRKTLLEAALPSSFSSHTISALRHIEREYLEKKYVNTETMLGDPVADIPAENFFVSEDNYAWDISELVQAITANSGVMRNPLSKSLFTTTDISQILSHPLASPLKPLQLKQHELKEGVRDSTIDWVAKVGKIMLEDQSVDTAASRKVIDEWLTYVVTLPEREQETIRELKIPAVDSTSRQAFDYTIGESLRDAVANTTCLHKVGDFLSQAARYLREQ